MSIESLMDYDERQRERRERREADRIARGEPKSTVLWTPLTPEQLDKLRPKKRKRRAR